MNANDIFPLVLLLTTALPMALALAGLLIDEHSTPGCAGVIEVKIARIARYDQAPRAATRHRLSPARPSATVVRGDFPGSDRFGAPIMAGSGVPNLISA